MKIKNDWLLMMLVFGSFLFVWHYRADLIEIAQMAKARNIQLNAECS